eukprot:TRINITY_DN7980_c0_g1_i4.p1 TRINITY_DN7980_c0_g1~~TRINITY_DN7980_c0_g1_i4.p1  ORF type:complete len:297 (-),score=65.88 TRINITY_DN7980_c0_g1_i4:98-988(-)
MGEAHDSAAAYATCQMPNDWQSRMEQRIAGVSPTHSSSLAPAARISTVNVAKNPMPDSPRSALVDFITSSTADEVTAMHEWCRVVLTSPNKSFAFDRDVVLRMKELLDGYEQVQLQEAYYPQPPPATSTEVQQVRTGAYKYLQLLLEDYYLRDNAPSFASGVVQSETSRQQREREIRFRMALQQLTQQYALQQAQQELHQHRDLLCRTGLVQPLTTTTMEQHGSIAAGSGYALKRHSADDLLSSVQPSSVAGGAIATQQPELAASRAVARDEAWWYGDDHEHEENVWLQHMRSWWH